MARRILQLLRFWRKPPDDPPPPPATSFLLPDLDDVRPFLPDGQPVSLRQLLQAISSPSSAPSTQPINVLINSSNPKRKLEPSQPSSQPCKRPRLTKPDITLVHRLPPHVWHLIFLYNQLESFQALVPSLPSTSLDAPAPVRTATSLSEQLRLALDAQQHRHAMALLSKSLAPIARRAAWSILLLGTLKMFDRVAQKFEAHAELTSHLRTCIIVHLPSIHSPKTRVASCNPSRPPPGARSPRPNSTRIPQARNLSQRHSPQNVSAATPHAQHRASGVNTPTQPRSVPTQASPSSSTKTSEKFQSVLIPPPPNSKEFETQRNTRLNSGRTISPLKSRSRHGPDEALCGEEHDLEEIILASSLPSLFLSIARSVQVCCVIGDERLGTRALKSLSVLSSLLTNLVRLFIEGGGQFNDLSTLVEGLRSITMRGQPSSLRVLSITGPNSTLSPPSHHGALSNHHRPSHVSPEVAPRPPNPSTSSSPTSHLSIQHLVLGSGIPLTIEQLHWLITSVTSSDPGLNSLRVSLKGAESNLWSSTSSSGSRRTLGARALLSQSFERIGGSLSHLALFEDWNAPLGSEITRRVTFEGGGGQGQGLVEDAVGWCPKLEVLCLTHGPLCSTTLPALLPRTLRLIEIHQPLSSLHDGQYLSSHHLWNARLHHHLPGLEKIRLVAPSLAALAPWKRAGFSDLQSSGVRYEFLLV